MSGGWRLTQVSPAQTEEAAELALLLWPHHTREELAEEYRSLLAEEGQALFLAYGKGEPLGFAQCSLRRDYVEGTDSSPVGYLEGIFVRERVRRQGIARALAQRCADWARAKGCVQFASDCALTNETSIAFHRRIGFDEAGRIVCFVRNLSG